MTLSHKLCTVFTALLLLVPVCGCGKLAFSHFEPTSHCPCCPSDKHDKDGNCDGDDCEHGFHSSRKYIAEKQYKLSDDQPDQDNSTLVEIGTLPVSQTLSFGNSSVIEPPPQNIDSSLWRLYCNFRL